MGQYYKAVLLADDTDEISTYLESWDYDSGTKLMEHSWIGNAFVEAVEKLLSTQTRVVWAGDYADAEPDNISPTNLYSRTRAAVKASPLPACAVGRYVINHDKHLYVDKATVLANRHGYRIHPLPILTVEGNGRGGGDLHAHRTSGEFSVVGTWARDRITISDTAPDSYEQLPFDLIEHW
ncbi:hypothetical protein [Nocardia transvalensis]|uniref:hypothetical protein n=1 Tax=Nocardia transvalensis TaxID=37333 RepID=UPI001892FB4F|nr:hypothetical protein [Nocardia transvalensis]MBF6332393.1 hypothetical protein [Nocardia transvalensis]